MTNTQRDAMNIVGLSARTSNNPGEADKDIPKLWERFMSENTVARIPHKVDQTVYAIYTDYEGDHTQPYTIVIGCNVDSLDDIPEDLTVKLIPEAEYTRFIAKGDLTKDAVINTWMDIWKTDLKRTYTTDIEVYGDKAVDPTNGEAEILIATE